MSDAPLTRKYIVGYAYEVEAESAISAVSKYIVDLHRVYSEYTVVVSKTGEVIKVKNIQTDITKLPRLIIATE